MLWCLPKKKKKERKKTSWCVSQEHSLIKHVYEISIKSRVHTRTGFSLPLLLLYFILCFICLLLFLSSQFN